MKKLFRGIFQGISCRLTVLRTIGRNAGNKKLEPEIYALDRFIPPGSVCFDIGAAYGRFTLAMSRLAGESGHVYSFEPGEYSYKVLIEIVRYYKLHNVTVEKKVVSDRGGSAELVIPFKKTGKLGPSLAYLKTIPYNEDALVESIPSITLDCYCLNLNLKRLDFIKCDVEGSELMVFRGGAKALETYKPVVLCEINAEALREKHNLKPSQICDFFRQMNYKAFAMRNGKLEKIIDCGTNDNYFFIPEENLI